MRSIDYTEVGEELGRIYLENVNEKNKKYILFGIGFTFLSFYLGFNYLIK
tara:strand:- start:477 stop:626 length:150 start_codon:yes stop_codon:yes gene_type:complete